MVSAFPKRPVSQDAVLEALEVVATGLGAKIDGVESRLNEKIDGVEARLDAKIDGVESRLNAKIDGVESRLDAKIDAVDAKVDDLKTEVVEMKKTMDENFLDLNRKFNGLDYKLDLMMAHMGLKVAE